MMTLPKAQTFTPGKTRITYGAPIFEKEERKAIERVLDRNRWAMDAQAASFEKELAEYIGVKHCFLVNSGSSALLLALAALALPKNSAVVIPATTFPTAFNAIIQNGYLPYVVDSDTNSFNINLKDTEQALKQGAKAIIVIHIAGNPAPMDKLRKLANIYKAKLIEDNCDGFGGSFGDKRLGAWGDISCTSFYAGHIINTGEGGAVFTNSSRYAERVRSLRDWGRMKESDKRGGIVGLPSDYPHRYIYTRLGYNFRILELQAAMGRVQLKRINYIKQKRQQNYDKLVAIFQNRPGLQIVRALPKSDPCWYSFPIFYVKRPRLIAYLERHNIETRPVFAGNILRQPGYQKIPVKKISLLVGADKILRHGFFIGLHPLIHDSAFTYIKKVVDDFFTHK